MKRPHMATPAQRSKECGKSKNKQKVCTVRFQVYFTGLPTKDATSTTTV